MAVSDLPNGISIPERTSARTSISSPKQKNRRSLPTSPPKDSSRRSSNHVKVKPASTEVISSLIETLSAISTPAEHHFESLPDINASRSLPASPSAWRTQFQGTSRGVVGHRNSPLLHPDHASIRGPSKFGHSPNDSIRRPSVGLSLAGSDDAHSIGQVSVEPQAWQSSTSLASRGSERSKSLRFSRSFKNLRLRSSKDSFQIVSKLEQQKLEMGTPRKERLFLSDSRSPSPARKDLDVPKRRSRMGANNTSQTEDQCPALVEKQTSRSPKRLFLNRDEASSEQDGNRRASYVPPSPDQIPRRDSSMRHSRVLSHAEKKRLSRSYKPDADTPEVDKGDVSVLSDISFKTAEEDPVDLLSGESGAVRRIRELKEQKVERDRLSMGDGPDAAFRPDDLEKERPPTPTIATKSEETNGDHMESIAHDGKEGEQESLPGDQSNVDKVEEEPSAPPPTVRTAPLRVETNVTNVTIRSVSMGVRQIKPSHSPASSRDETRSSSLPSRRNSRLLKRLSQPSSPLAGEKQRRRLSNPVLPPVRTSSYLTSGGDSVDDAIDRYISDPRLSQKAITSQTGRVITFSEVGDPNGSVVFCCVGMGLTRYVTAFYDELAAMLKLRLITPDRPGVGGSESHEDGQDTPLTWPDDVRCICEHLRISKFSLLAHSAGAIYALATALRMPQHIRCRVHLLAPWIPPSQLTSIGSQQNSPSNALPYSQRFLRSLPTPFLKAANSSFFSFTSITTSLPRSPKRSKQRNKSRSNTPAAISPAVDTPNGLDDEDFDQTEKENQPPIMNGSVTNLEKIKTNSRNDLKDPAAMEKTTLREKREQGRGEKSGDYTQRLTTAIWDAATTNANSAIDLIVCLESRQPIGFRYVDITRAVVIHHGSKDTRVPVENVKWLGAAMRRCEVRVLEGEGHGLMASASVMGGVLTEMSQEWDDWLRVVRGKRGLA